MKNKDFELSLWRDYIPSAGEGAHIHEEKLYILANQNMEQFQGRIYNLVFTRKTDGTKNITFSAPQQYFDVYENVKKDNEYNDWIQTKSKLKLHYKDKWYTFIVNTKEKKKEKKQVIYSYEATDYSVEELSKVGYTINLTDSEDTIEISGIGTLEELTTRVLEPTDWNYSAELTTANQQEHTLKTKYNPLIQLYEDVQEPTMIYKSHYSPFLQKYVYKTEYRYNLDLYKDGKKKSLSELENKWKTDEAKITNIESENSLPIYYTTLTNTSCSGTTNNIIANNSKFTSAAGWDIDDTSYAYPIREVTDGEENYFYISSGSAISTKEFTVNKLESKVYYAFRLIDKDLDSSAKFSLTFYRGTNSEVLKETNLSVNKYYVVSLPKDLSNCYLEIEAENNICMQEIQLFQIVLRNSNDEEVAVNGSNLGIGPIQKGSIKEFSVTEIKEDYQKRGKISEGIYILLPNALITATSKPTPFYFIEPYTNLAEVQTATGDVTLDKLDSSHVLAIDEKVLTDKAFSILKIDKEANCQRIYEYINDDNKKEYLTFSDTDIEENAEEFKDKNKYITYKDEWKQEIYYIPYQIQYNDNTYWLWKNILLKYGNEKRRLVTGSRSNCWNLIQDIAEKFEVYPRFTILTNPETGEFIYGSSGRPIKYVYYVDRVGKANYSGFKEGINLSSINRKILSNDIVTKMYVNNIDASYSDTGLVSIQLSDQNPSKENYIYNFRHYLNTGALDDDFLKELEEYENKLKTINEQYMSAAEKRDQLADELNELEGALDLYENSFEQSKSEIVDKINEFTITSDYYTVSKGGQGFTPNGGKIKVGEKSYGWYTEDGTQVKSDKTEYNSFYQPKYGEINDKMSGSLIVERHNLLANSKGYESINPKTIKIKIKEQTGKESLLSDDFLTSERAKELLSKSLISGEYLTNGQKEVFFLNEDMPYNSAWDELYYIKQNNGYRALNNNEKDKFKEGSLEETVYLRYLTSENSQWYYDKKTEIFLCNYYGNTVITKTPNSEKSYKGSASGHNMRYLIQPRVAKGVNLGEELVKQDKGKITGWVKSKSEVNLISPSVESTLMSKREAIKTLIDKQYNENNSNSIIPMLHNARVSYYKTKKLLDKQKIEVQKLLTKKKKLTDSFEYKYLPYIKEGYWSGSGYSNNDTYFLDALTAGTNAALPKVEYSINVIDLSPIEYYQDYDVDIGDETFIIDKDMFGVDKNGTPIREKVIITQLSEQLDDNSKNKLTIRNYTNRFEELFQRITASVTSVEKNEEIWSRAEALNANRTIPSSLLTTLHGLNDTWVNNTLGLQNDFQVDESGITLTSLLDGNYKLKITSLGIFVTEDALRNSTWTTGITAEGINADIIRTGHLMTNKISIFSEEQPAQVWDNLGISMYALDGNSYIDLNTFVRLDQYGLYFAENKSEFGYNGSTPWFVGKTSTDAVNTIRDNAKVSLTKLGFRYNSSPGSNDGAKILIGDLDDANEGINFTNNGQTIFKVSTENDGIAQIMNFKFDATKMWADWNEDINKLVYYSKQRVPGVPGLVNAREGNLVYKNGTIIPEQDYDKLESLDNVYYPFYLGASGIAMKNISLDPLKGKATFKNIKLTGGTIDGNVTIQQAMLGPFLVSKSMANNEDHANKFYDEYLYAEFKNDESLDYFNPKTGKINTGALPYRSELTKNKVNYGRPGWMLNHPNKVYLGEFKLTKKLLNMCSFPKALTDGASTTGGLILSIGDNFWMHSSGYGYLGGKIYINGTVYADKIIANDLDVGGVNVMSEIQNNAGEVTQIINKYISSNSAPIQSVLGDYTTGIGAFTIKYILPAKHNTTIERSVPAIRFKNKDWTGYLFMGENGYLYYYRDKKDGKINDSTNLGQLDVTPVTKNPMPKPTPKPRQYTV